MPTLVGQTIRDIAFDEKRQIKMTYWPERWEAAPDPDAWRAPLGQPLVYDVLKWRFLAEARAVVHG